MGSRVSIYFIFALSGAAGLTYQVIWSRWLSLVMGSTTVSVSVVLSSFMLGLALGSWLASRHLMRVRRPLAAYGWLELGVGAFAVAFPVFHWLCDAVFTALVGVNSPPHWDLLVRVVLAFAVLVVPTTLMGATLPMMTEYLRRKADGGTTWKAGLLYALNTLGAALGTILASFLGIEYLGVRDTALLAASINLVVAFWALSRANKSGMPEAVSKPEFTDFQRAGFDARLALVILTLSGAAALASEVLWTRLLASLIGNSTYAFALLLVVYLIGIALGGGVASLFVKRLSHLTVWLIGTQAAIACWTLSAVHLFYALADHLHELSDTAQPIGTILGMYLQSATILFPLAFLSGTAFPLATRILEPDSEEASGERVAHAYSLNTVGAVVGAAGAGFLVAPHLDFVQSIYALAALYALTAGLGATALLVATTAIPRARLVGTAAATALCVMTTGVVRTSKDGVFEERIRADLPGAEVVYHRPGLQGVTTVVEFKGKRTLLVNGVGMTRKVIATKMMAHLPMLLHPDPQDTLVICFGMGTSYRSAMSHGGNVTTVELVEEVFETFELFHDDAQELRAESRGRMVVNDGRSFLKLTRDRFDVITIDPPPPIDAAGVNHLYSYEFLKLARDRLKGGGIMAHWIPLPGSSAGVNDREIFLMLLRTFTEVFPHHLVLESTPRVGLHVVGFTQPIGVTSADLAQRMAEPAVARDLQEWGTVSLDYLTGLKPADPNALADVPLVTDDRPRLEFDLMRAWRSGVRKELHTLWW